MTQVEPSRRSTPRQDSRIRRALLRMEKKGLVERRVNKWGEEEWKAK